MTDVGITSLPSPTSRQGRSGPIWMVLLLVVVVMLLPSKFVIGALALTPAAAWAIVMAGVWFALRISGVLVRRFTILHLALLGVSVGVILSYLAATMRPLTSDELSAADRGLMALLALAGVFLMTADAPAGQSDLRRIINVITGLTGLVALGAAAQYLLGYDPLAGLAIPGLDVSFEWETDSRSGLVRAQGTAVHPIEYGAVVSMFLPIMLHVAVHSRDWRWLWWLAVVLAAATGVMTISRSAIIGLAIGYLVLLPTWPRKWRRRSYLLLLAGLLGLLLIFPDLVGTILSLFTYFSVDPSTQGRTGDYQAVVDYFLANPWFGLGEGTFLPSLYRILDNQYLLTLVSQGIVGLAALLFLFGSAIFLVVRTRRRSADAEARSLAQSLLASVLVAVALWALFDGFSFPQAAISLMLLLGLVAALSRQGTYVRDKSPGRGMFLRRASLSTVVAAVIVAVIVLGRTGQVQYVSTVSLLVRPETPDTGLFASDPNPFDAADLLGIYLRGSTGQAAVVDAGGSGSYAVAQGNGSLGALTEFPGRGPVLTIRALGGSPEESEQTLSAVLEVADEQLLAAQLEVGAPRTDLLVLDIIASSGPLQETGSDTRGMIAILLAVGSLSSLIYAGTASVGTARARRQQVSARAISQLPDAPATD